MGIFRQFPYSNFHEMNMDEIIKIVKSMLEDWARYYNEWDNWKETVTNEWAEMQTFINNYFDNLDVQTEINNKITAMVNSGEFSRIVDPYVPPAVANWLADHITQPTGVVIDDSLTVSGACADAKATGDAIIDLKNKLGNINGSQIKTSQIDYSNLTISENKKITGYDTSTFLPILDNENGSVVADFAITDVAMFNLLKFPRCTKSNQWVIIYGATIANNYTKTNMSTGSVVDFSNADYGIINMQNLRNNQNFSRIAIAFDELVDITVDSQFASFFDVMNIVKENQNAEKNVRSIDYSSTIEISTAKSSKLIPFKIYQGEQLKFTNNTSGATSLHAFDSNNTEVVISTGIPAGDSVTFTADRDYISLLYWSQQTGTLDVKSVNAIIPKMREETEASVNMFESIGAIGDSYTAGSTRNSAGTWKDYRNLSWIATMGKRSGTDWKNYGHGGATTKSFLETTEFANALSDNACDIYFFALGQNDGNQSLTIGTVADIHDDDYTLNADTFYGNYGRIIQQIKNHAPNAKLVMITNWVRGSTWTAYDAAIRAIASHYSIPVIEPFDDYFFNSALYQDYKESGHPTAMGYSSMGIAMERLFSKCVIDNPTYFKFATIG